MNDNTLFGLVWNNQDINHKTRCIITVVALMSSGVTDSSLEYHLAVEAPGENSSNEWLEAVTDEVYGKLQ